MEIKQPSAQKLILTESQFIRQLVPLAVSGAGLMLIVGSIREYGIQSWFRTTYWGGAVVMVMGAIYFLFGPWSSRIELNVGIGELGYRIRRGIRTYDQQQVKLSQISEVRIEQLDPNHLKGRRPHYRLAAQIDGTWTPLNHWSQGNTYDYELAGKKLTAFIKQYKQEG